MASIKASSWALSRTICAMRRRILARSDGASSLPVAIGGARGGNRRIDIGGPRLGDEAE